MDCLICCDAIETAAVFQCGHAVCHECGLRLRVLPNMAGQKCPLCNGASPTLYLVHHPSPGCSDFRSLCEDCEIWDNEWQFATNSRVVLELVDELRAARCRQCDAPSFPCSTDLQAHLKQKHKLQFCALCIEHRPLFMSERILYTAKELEMVCVGARARVHSLISSALDLATSSCVGPTAPSILCKRPSSSPCALLASLCWGPASRGVAPMGPVGTP